VFNIGNTEEVTILELAQRIRTLTDSSSEIVFVPYDEAYAAGFEDMPRRVPDLTKIANAIGYRPTLGLDEILRTVIAWERGRTEAATWPTATADPAKRPAGAYN
jgi:UDP-glucose 4-epimerase